MYDKSLILNYIYGNDIENYSLEQLENDSLFMCEVIKISKEKQVYIYASDSLKKDYNFVLNTINTFNSDYIFIKQVADYYLENNKDDFKEVLQINVLMSNLIENESEKLNYSFKARLIYEQLLFKLKEDEKKLSNFSMLFLYIYDIFIENKMILDYFSKNMVSDIFKESQLSLKEILHNNFEKPDDLYKMGIKNFIINFLKRYDDMLSWYVSVNTYIIDDLYKKICNELKSWKYDNNLNIERKIAILWQEGEKMYDNYDDLTYPFSSYLDTVIKKLNLDDLYKKYSNDNYYGVYFIDEINMNFKDKIFVNELTKLTNELFEKYKIDKYLDDYNEVKSCKIINMSYKNLNYSKKSNKKLYNT